MSSALDASIKAAGKPAVIVRATGNLDTWLYEQKKDVRVSGAHEFQFLMPSDCEAVTGDVVTCGGKTYLVVALEQIESIAGIEAYRGTLYRCNNSVDAYALDDETSAYDTLTTSAVPVFVHTASGVARSDADHFSHATSGGSVETYTVYAPATAGITTSHMLTDAAGRDFRLEPGSDPFTISGVNIFTAIWVR